ncbi:hypothetical protein B0I35DRAFT_495969, partial [Stachybotrys elegans]
MHTSIVFGALAPLLSLFQLVDGQRLDKPIVDPVTPSMDVSLLNTLRPVRHLYRLWVDGNLPLRCYDIAIQEGFSPADVDAYDVTYDDCETPWVFCRHRSAEMDLFGMRDTFGRIPVRTRQYVRTIMGLPGARSAYAFSDRGDIIFFGDCDNSPTVFIHEFAHILDRHGVAGHNDSDFSRNPIWEAAYDADPRISDEYAQTNQQENWAQEVVLATFDRVSPGGLPAIQPSHADIGHQYGTARIYLENKIIPGGTCQFRWPDETRVNETIPLLKVQDVPESPPIKCDFSGHKH